MRKSIPSFLLISLLLVASWAALPGTPALAYDAGNALDFDGYGDYAGGSGVSTTLSTITIEAWVYHRTVPASSQRYVRIGSDIVTLRQIEERLEPGSLS